MTRVALAQSDVAYGNLKANIGRAADWLERASAENADLLVLPEAFLTGYAAPTLEGAEQIAIEVEADEDLTVTRWDASLDEMQRLVDDKSLHTIVGFAGRDQAGLYNGVMLLLPRAPARLYRKTHLPFLGFDRFARPGDKLVVWDTDFGKIAPLICFDLRIPEAARALALMGAELIVVPTNWPNLSSVTPRHIAPARAAENKVYLAACDRVGDENGQHFIGMSAVFDPFGEEVVRGGEDEEFLVADIDLATTRNKRSVITPGEYEIDPFATRQPELYASLTYDPTA